jgi:hypothetical protein
MNKFTKIKKTLAVSLCSTMLFSGQPRTSGMDFNNTNSTDSNNNIHKNFLISFASGVASSTLVEGIFFFCGIFILKNVTDWLFGNNDLTKAIKLFEKADELIDKLNEQKFDREKIKNAKMYLKSANELIYEAEKYQIVSNRKDKNVQTDVKISEKVKLKLKNIFLSVVNILMPNSSTNVITNKVAAVKDIVESLKSCLEKNEPDFKTFSNNLPEIEAENILKRIEEILDENIIKVKNKNNEIKNKEEEDKKEYGKIENQKQKISESKDDFLNSNNPHFLNILNNKEKK